MTDGITTINVNVDQLTRSSSTIDDHFLSMFITVFLLYFASLFSNFFVCFLFLDFANLMTKIAIFSTVHTGAAEAAAAVSPLIDNIL